MQRPIRHGGRGPPNPAKPGPPQPGPPKPGPPKPRPPQPGPRPPQPGPRPPQPGPRPPQPGPRPPGICSDPRRKAKNSKTSPTRPSPKIWYQSRTELLR